MGEVEIIINQKTLVHGQGVKESIDKSSAESVVCFDETITRGSSAIGYKLDIDKVVYEWYVGYNEMRKIFENMLSTPGMITTREVIRLQGKRPFVIVKEYSGCILDGADYEMKPEELSAQSLSFLCSSKREWTEWLTTQ